LRARRAGGDRLQARRADRIVDFGTLPAASIRRERAPGRTARRGPPQQR
jgi:hypothetical protein